MPTPRRTTVLSFLGFAAVLCLAILFGSHNEALPQTKPIRDFGEGDYGDVVGIELGRTYSRVGIFRNDTFQIIADEEGRSLVPSYVAFVNRGPPLVGFEAMYQAVSNPKNTIHDVRLLIGRNFSDPELQGIIKDLSYDVVDSHGRPSIKVQINGVDKYVNPEEMSAKILEKLKDMAEAHLNRTIQYAVITVPSHFSDSQREATKDAAKIAGLNVLRVVNEPTAACIAYGLEMNDGEYNFITYDLGAKESHLALGSVDCGVYEILAQAADRDLGGEDFEITQAPLQELNKKSSDRVLDMGKQLLEKAGLEKKEINGIILSGNPAHIAKIQPLIEAFLDGKKALFRDDVNPDEAVVHGAAIQGHVLSSYGDTFSPALNLRLLSLGIETSGSIFTKLIPRYTIIPTRKTLQISTVMDNQEKVVIRILEGERAIASKNRFLGNLELTGLPLKPRGVPEIEVTFEMGEDEVLTVLAREKESRKEAELVITGNWDRYTVEEIDAIIMDAEGHYEEDQLLLKDLPIDLQDENGEHMFEIVVK